MALPSLKRRTLARALTALGATMERYVRCHYAGKYQSPCMQSFIVAPAASGRGTITHPPARYAYPTMISANKWKKEMNAYKRQKSPTRMMGKKSVPKAEIPRNAFKQNVPHFRQQYRYRYPFKILWITNGTGLICRNRGGYDLYRHRFGIQSLGETLRRAFDHDWLAYNRRTNQEYRENKKSYLSLLLSGTPAQVKPLIPSVENGLFSRQLFYYMHGIYQWINQFDENEIDLEAIFTAIGLEWNKLLNLLKEHGLHTLRLTDEQKQEFNDLFFELFTRSTIANGREMNSSIARMAVNICRIMSVVAMLRALENPQPYQYQASSHPLLTPDKEIAADNIKDGIITRWDMTITPEDF